MLTGVADDVAGMRSLLTSRGFDVTVRTSAAETGHLSVIRELDDVVDSLHADDLLIFYFSGHGLRIADKDGDEPDDEWDEAIALSDGLIPDDTFRALWRRLRSGVRVVAIVDACHSSTASLGLRVAHEPLSLPLRQSPGPYLLVLSACRDEERAFQGAGGDDGGGIVTSKMLEVLERDGTLAYGPLWSTVATEVRDRFPTLGQTPGLRYVGPDAALLSERAFTV